LLKGANSMKKAFLFPGQGAQKSGMGKAFYDEYTEARKVYEDASSLLGLDIESLCFEKNDKLDLTQYTQVAMVTTGIAMLKVIDKLGLKADTCAGLSLGEYEALFYSGVLRQEDAIRVIQKRGKLMAEAVPAKVGAMAAVLSLDAKIIEDCLKDMDGVWIANYNCPGQIVISGKAEAVKEAGEKLKQAGAKRVLPLNVSGPFHSKLLKEAGDKLYNYLLDIEVSKPRIPYVANVNAEFINDEKDIKELLKKQVYSSVKFEQSIRKMIESGVDTFIEIGAGKTLSGFVKKIDSNVKSYSIETVQDLNAVLELGL
jgi:[acyl-carrier-protein] S-malonyltransferase